MIYTDSWIWIELFLKGDKYYKIYQSLREAQKEGIVLSSMGLLEIKYTLIRKMGLKLASEAIEQIESIEEVTIVPVIADICKNAADLKVKYYSRKRQISFADVIHLATAIRTECDELYTGDSDFKGIEEIKVRIV